MAANTVSQLPGKLNIALYRGDDFVLGLKWWQDEARTALVDLTGWSAKLDMRTTSDGTLQATLASSSGEIVLGGTPDNIEVIFSSALTATLGPPLVYDLQMIDPANRVRTLISGTIKVVADVTS